MGTHWWEQPRVVMTDTNQSRSMAALTCVRTSLVFAEEKVLNKRCLCRNYIGTVHSGFILIWC